MPEYIILCRFTEKGVKEIKNSPNRIAATKKMFEQAKGKVKSLYAVLGQYDTVGIVEAIDDEAMAQLSLQISSMGAVQVQTLRAFTEEQFMKIVNKIT